MPNKTDIDDFIKLTDDNERSQLDSFERDFLIPNLFSRLDVFLELFEAVKTTSEDPKTGTDLDDAFSHAFSQQALDKSKLPGANYTKGISSLVTTNFIEPINKIKAEFISAESVTDFTTLKKFALKIKHLCSSIKRNKETLFYYNFRPFLILKDAQNRQTYGPPQEVNITLLPFEVTLNEIAGIAETTEDAIDRWSKTWNETKGKMIDFFGRQNELRYQRRSGTNQILLLIATIGLTLVASTFFLLASDPFDLNKRNQRLEAQMEDLKVKISLQETEIGQLLKENIKLQKTRKMEEAKQRWDEQAKKTRAFLKEIKERRKDQEEINKQP